jgi:hypothetical protein
MAGVAGIGEDLRGGLASIQIRLSVSRQRSHEEGSPERPRFDSIAPRHVTLR